MIGTVPGGIIRHPEAENLAFDPTYLWVNFRTNDSVDHCTMEEFVQARVSGEPTAHCAGRYREVLDVVGQPATEARSQLQAEGMQVDVRVAEAAPSAELAYTVADQKPGARTAATRGSRIEIGVYGEHSAALTAPDVIGLPAADARDRLEAAGLVAEVVIGDEAPAADRTYTVYDQNPGAGVGLAAGGTVQLSIYSDYRPRTRVPYLGGSTVQEARQQLTDLGLSPVQGETVPAYSNESEGLVADTSPGEGVEVDRGTEVQLLTYGQFTHPRCEELLRDGRGAASSNLDRARSLLVEARDLDCPSDGIDASIADLDDRIAQRDRCNALVAQGGQQEQAGNLQGARATYRQALSSGCTNPGLSDAIARIDSTIRDSERERLCNEAIARGNAQWNAGNLAGARATYRQARADGCTNSGLDDGIAGIESAIRDQQQRERERLERERRERDDRVTVPHWVLVETRINPTREPTDFVVGVTPNFYSDRNNGSFRRWSVGETNMTYSSRWQDHGYLELDVSIGVDFTGPPAQLVPGQTVNLSATFSHRGTVNSGNPGIAFEYRGDGIGVSGPAGHTYSPWAPEFRGVSSISPNFQVPAVHGGQIALTAFLWNCGACNVTWVYEARQPEPPPPPVDTIVPPVDTGSGTGPGPFSVVVGVYLPFNQQDAGTGDARGAIESRLNDVSQWVLAIPLMLDIGGDAVRAYSRSAFTPGSRWSMPIGVQAQLVDGQSGTMNGALLLEVVGVYDNPAAAMAAQPAVQQAGDPLRFRAGDGRMRQQLDRDGNASTITGGPLQTGWSTQAQQGARQLLLEMMQNFDLCFVATAVYESREGEPLDRLRRFRDEVLLQSPAGRRLAMLYYRSGPALAGWVNRNPAIRPLLRPVVDALGSALDTVAGNPTLSAALDLVLRTLAPTFDPLPLDPGRPATARSFSPWPLPWLQPPTDDDSTQESSR
jgi:beta-lactam-binding protein with PASTA domain